MLSTLECPPKSDLDSRIDEYLDSDDPEVAAMGCTAIAKALGCHHESVQRRKRARQGVAAPPYRPEPVWIGLDELVLDDRLQMRPKLDMHAVKDYAALVDDLDPVEVVRVELTPYLAHGFHRYHAHKLEGLTRIRAFVHVGTFEDALEVACRANAKHQVPRCDETIGKAVATYHALHPDASARAVGKALSVHHERVSAILEGYGTVRERRTAKREGANGHAGANGVAAPPAQPTLFDACEDIRQAGGSDWDDIDDPAAFLGREPGADDDKGMEEEAGEAPSPPRGAPDGLPPDLADDVRALPLWDALEGRDTRAAFGRDAVLYFRLREAKESLGNLHRRHMPKAVPGEPKGHYQHVVDHFLSTDHPRKWVLCRRCDGAGCQSCLRRGYAIQGVR
jgi:hypothetical protein